MKSWRNPVYPWGVLALLAVLAIGQVANERITKIGNAVTPSDSGSDWQDTTFLSDDISMKAGVVFAFSAFFRNTNPVIFQFWRPVRGGNTTQLFRLIGALSYTPTESMARTDVYIHAVAGGECIRVQGGDRLGIFTPVVPGSVAYTFDAHAPRAYTYTEKRGRGNGTIPINQTVQFEELPFPYDFSVTAWVDTELTRYPPAGKPGCPTDLFVPNPEVTTAPVITGPPGPMGPQGGKGETGATGPAGPQGATGPHGPQGLPGIQGPDGPRGETGDKGDKGDSGDKGDKGEPGQAAPTVQAKIATLMSGCSWCNALMTPVFFLGILVWLVLLTVMVVIVLCVVTCRRRRRKREGLAYTHNIRGSWEGSRTDLWKSYENSGGSSEVIVTPGEVGVLSKDNVMDPTYYTIEEGVTPC